MTTTQTVISIVGLFLAACLGIIGTLILINLTTLREEIRNISIDVTKLKESKVSTSTLEDKFALILEKLKPLVEIKTELKEIKGELKETNTTLNSVDKRTIITQKDIDYVSKNLPK